MAASREDDEAGPAMPESGEGSWRQWKRSLAGFAEAVASLAALRWEMAKSEAAEWGRAALLRMVLAAAAVVLALLALVFFAVGLVLLLAMWLGSLVAAVFVCFGICVLAAGALAFAATRGRGSRPVFERTAGEIRKDFETWTGGEAGGKE